MEEVQTEAANLFFPKERVQSIKLPLEKIKVYAKGWLNYAVCARQLLKAPCTERYALWLERTAVSHRLLLDIPIFLSILDTLFPTQT